MKRTQIYFDEKTHRRLTRLAKLRDEPMGKLVRQFVDEKLEQEEHKNNAGGLVELAELAKKKGWAGPHDAVERHNEYFIEAWKDNHK